MVQCRQSMPFHMKLNARERRVQQYREVGINTSKEGKVGPAGTIMRGCSNHATRQTTVCNTPPYGLGFRDQRLIAEKGVILPSKLQ